MNDPEELALGAKAITCGVRGCFEWKRGRAEKVRNEHDLKGLTPEGIREGVIDLIIQQAFAKSRKHESNTVTERITTG